MKSQTKIEVSLKELTVLRFLLRVEYMARTYAAMKDAADKIHPLDAMLMEVIDTNFVYSTLDTPLAMMEKVATLSPQVAPERLEIPLNAAVFPILSEVVRLDTSSIKKDVSLSPQDAAMRDLVAEHQPSLVAKFDAVAGMFPVQLINSTDTKVTQARIAKEMLN